METTPNGAVGNGARPVGRAPARIGARGCFSSAAAADAARSSVRATAGKPPGGAEHFDIIDQTLTFLLQEELQLDGVRAAAIVQDAGIADDGPRTLGGFIEMIVTGAIVGAIYQSAPPEKPA